MIYIPSLDRGPDSNLAVPCRASLQPLYPYLSASGPHPPAGQVPEALGFPGQPGLMGLFYCPKLLPNSPRGLKEKQPSSTLPSRHAGVTMVSFPLFPLTPADFPYELVSWNASLLGVSRRKADLMPVPPH